MNKSISLLLGAAADVLLLQPAQSQILDEILGHGAVGVISSQRPARPAVAVKFPGRLLGGATDHEGLYSFKASWKYRSDTYELVFARGEDLARCIYSLAIHAGDISADTKPERFYRGVSGFHYSIDQVVSWLNHTAAADLSADEQKFIQMLYDDKVISLSGGRYQAANIGHILGSAPGLKRSYEQNITHERLHVLWDCDAGMKAKFTNQFKALSAEEQAAVRQSLKQYNQSNEAQLIEEWAIAQAEQNPGMYLWLQP